MPINISISGNDNIVDISEHNIAFGTGNINLCGDGNRIAIDDAMAWGQSNIVLMGGATVEIGKHCVFSRLSIYAGPKSSIRIGTNVGFSGATSLTCHEPARLSIGNDCLFASETDVSTSDMHSILDATGRRINPPKAVEIGDKVWIGFRSIVLKGSRIGDGSIVGAGSIVAGRLGSNLIAAGVPARAIRKGVTWDRELIPVPPSMYDPGAQPSRWERLRKRIGLN